MDDPDAGDRTGQWFWSMLVSLGLGSMDDRKFDRYFVDQTLERFLNAGTDATAKAGSLPWTTAATCGTRKSGIR
ncbi:MAG: hypothetical protein ACLRNW_01500 [Neglectibacter sp.]